MPAYNFQARFATSVRSGKKLTTIRRGAPMVGKAVHLFTGMRTKQCVRLGRGEIVSVEPIRLGYLADGRAGGLLGALPFCEDDEAMKSLAQADGFDNPRAMLAWFKLTYDNPRELADGGRVVFEGFLIKWKLQP